MTGGWWGGPASGALKVRVSRQSVLIPSTMGVWSPGLVFVSLLLCDASVSGPMVPEKIGMSEIVFGGGACARQGALCQDLEESGLPSN